MDEPKGIISYAKEINFGINDTIQDPINNNYVYPMLQNFQVRGLRLQTTTQTEGSIPRLVWSFP